MELRLLMFLAIAGKAFTQYVSTGSIFQSVGTASSMTNSESDDFVIDSSFFACDREKSCQIIVKAKTDKKFSKLDSRLTKEEEKAFTSVYVKERNDTMLFNEFWRRLTLQNLTEALPPGFCKRYFPGPPWLVFQRRIDNSVDFNRNWNAYKQGFGDVTGNFWLGLENLHLLTASEQGATLRVEFRHVSDPSKLFYAQYADFSVSNEAAGYRLNTGSFTGNVGDSLKPHNTMKFSTFDQDNDASSYHCAEKRSSGWWFKTCQRANLNGQFPPVPYTQQGMSHMTWYDANNEFGGVYFSEMKLACR
ncbi:microfibril-associated glycoprotein 4-like [Rhopilema esculentum]|uniref:microfibril-associated glycoprotein 4-like n=1 Tax=Rhopilema esculentum TaxID=499914 RepID=UPI0031D99B02